MGFGFVSGIMNRLGSNGSRSSMKFTFGGGNARSWLGCGFVVMFGLGLGGAISMASIRSWIEWRRRAQLLVLCPWLWWYLQYWDGLWFLGKTAGGRDGCNGMRYLAATSRSRASDKLMLREIKLLWPLGFGF